jgi:hypothetical protein
VSDEATEIRRLHGEGQARFALFLLGAAALAIAFALQATQGQALDVAHAPIGAALACWAASFASGMAGIGRRQQLLRGELEMAKLRQGLAEPPVAGASADTATAALRELVAAEGGRVARRLRWQQRLLLAGGACYIAGHVWAMARAAGG